MLTKRSRSDQGALQEQLALHTGSSALTFEVRNFPRFMFS
jgi:hypothetical protein